MPRQTFVCIHCGLRLIGRLNPRTGLIYPDDRTATSDAPAEPCVCPTCLKQVVREVAETTR